MSRFFRSSSSDTSSSEDEPPSDQDESNDTGQAIDGTNDGTDSITTSLRRLGPGNDGGVQSQMLLHALLEERCMNEALREHQRANGTRGHHSDAAVRATADANLMSWAFLAGAASALSITYDTAWMGLSML
ncbi:hypothetical protein LTR17_003703 [Elasticomyces elasticus]|nr:hypothetical protein LTR17_003703 [Elasticomyces elasticus]